MRIIFIYLVVFVFLTGCKEKLNQNDIEKNLPKKQMETEEKSIDYSLLKVQQESFDSIPGTKLEEVFGIPIRKKLKEHYSGFYSFVKDEDSIVILHGPFEISHYDNIQIEEDWLALTKIKYKGSYENGLKSGLFSETLYHDDGVDLYSNWEVIIYFSKDFCKKSTFKGQMGYEMPISELVLDNNDSCTFDFVVDSAFQVWSNEFNKRN